MQAYFYKETIVHFLQVNKSYIFFKEKVNKIYIIVGVSLFKIQTKLWKKELEISWIVG